LTTGFGFFLPVGSGNWLGLFIKVILFILIFLILYPFFFEAESLKIRIKKSGPVEEELSVDEDTGETAREREWKGFGETFRRYTEDFLTVIRSAVVASNVGLYLQKGKEGLEFHAGESEAGRWDRHVLIDDGSIIDHVAKDKVPVLEGNLPIGTVLDGLPGLEIRSILGVPLMWEGELVGVLALGGEATESFGAEDQEFLVKCGGLITKVMAACHRGIRWEMEQEVYAVHLELETMLAQVEDEESAVSVFAELIKSLFPFDRLTLCVKDGEEGIIRNVIGQIDNLDTGLRFSLSEGLNGWVLNKNSAMLIADIERGDYIRPRYFREENSKHGLRSFLGIPMGRGKEVWGCLSLESRAVDQYSEKGKDVLSLLADNLYIILERFQLLNHLRELGTSCSSKPQSKFILD